jgi:hypothetical protein
MKKKSIGVVFVVSILMLMMVGSVFAAGGFDQYGYNNKARLFNGTGESWAMGKFGMTKAQADAYMGVYAQDKLVMKWNAEWDRGNAENWANGPYAAWTDNEWNGAFKGGSGAVWHYKIVWVGGSHPVDYEPAPDGGYYIWGQFEVIMDQGKDPSYGPGHFWFAHATPTGYGAAK